jgi:peptidyl-prolyl cis-trans isomerase D
MIEKIRRYSETWLSKILMIIIAGSFVFWGVSGSLFTGSGVAVTIGDAKISAQELDRELRRQLSQIQAAMGGIGFDYRQAVQMGLLDQVVNNLIYRILLDKEAKEEGILVSDEKIYSIIQGTPEFQDENKNFSPEKFAYVLDANGITERALVDEVANSVARDILVNTVTSHMDASDIAAIAYRHRNETRSADVLALKISDEKTAEAPGADELKALYEKNIAKFQEREYRRISYITIDAATARKYRDIGPNDSDKAYRTMLEIGENIIDEITGGASSDEAAKGFAAKKTTLPEMDSEGRTRAGAEIKDPAFSPKLRDIAFFALDENGVSDPEDAGDAVILVLVEKVHPAKPKDIEAVKGELAALWKSEKQAAMAAGKASEILAKLEAGATFNKSAAEAGRTAVPELNVKTGRFNNAYPPDFLNKLFVAEKNKPFMMRADDTYYVAAVRSVTLPEITDKADFEKFRAAEEKNLAANILDEYIAYLYRKYGVKRNEKVLRAFYNN